MLLLDPLEGQTVTLQAVHKHFFGSQRLDTNFSSAADMKEVISDKLMKTRSHTDPYSLQSWAVVCESAVCRGT